MDTEHERMNERRIEIDIRHLPSGNLARDAAEIQRIEEMGADAVWIAEHSRNPFFPLTIAAKSTTSIRLATRDALAFARSPMVTAQIAWDLARQSRGRLVLGLSAQPASGVVQQGDDNPFDTVARMREYIESLRAIWNTFQNDDRLRYRGQYYQFRLMAPFFNPGPIDNPDIPIYLSADNLDLCHLAGEICQGVHVPRLHTASYLREAILPNVTRGLEMAGRSRDDICVCVSPLFVTGNTKEETHRAARQTRTHIVELAKSAMGRDVLSHHDWQDFSYSARDHGERPQASDRWRSVSDEMLREFAIVAEPADVADAVFERYRGKADRVLLPWSQDNRELVSRVLTALKY